MFEGYSRMLIFLHPIRCFVTARWSKKASLARLYPLLKYMFVHISVSQQLSRQVSEIWDDDFYPNLTNEQVELEIPLSNCMLGYKTLP